MAGAYQTGSTCTRYSEFLYFISWIKINLKLSKASPSVKVGKELLWRPASPGVPGSPAPRRSLQLTVSTPVPASPLSQVQSFRRANLVNGNIKPPEMSPKVRLTKSYSKWEKQEIEAQAMSRLRRKKEEEAKLAEEIEKCTYRV